ncbi:hypothetical protein RchiOBHm_Chr7g0227061 [Rosa chinensis]|uniref:Uncharacterized protein n=1 Tax=Rosa chinensis TaxID=74649 RepID=A0A2P6PEH8_ROSCH|nr:hypothetical protein RchiOBHm_Chr7g0227061 [Rosa chinensis]
MLMFRKCLDYMSSILQNILLAKFLWNPPPFQKNIFKISQSNLLAIKKFKSMNLNSTTIK